MPAARGSASLRRRSPPRPPEVRVASPSGAATRVTPELAWLLPSAEVALITLAASLANGVLGAGGAILFVPLALYVLPSLGTRLDTHEITSLSLVQGLCAFV